MDLKSRAESFLTTIVNHRETASIEHLLHPNAQFKHDDLPPMSTAELLEFWPQILDQSPDFRVQILATVAEGLQVWVYSRVEGRLGKGVMDDVHMLEFDENGLLIRSRGIQREVVERLENH